MDLDRFLNLPGTTDGRKVITLMADPSMTDAMGQPAGFLSLVDKGANLRRFAVVKAEDLADPHRLAVVDPLGLSPAGLVDRFLAAMTGLVSKFRGQATKAEDPGPLTFDAAVQAERLRRARWEATDALWDVIRNIMGSDLDDKVGAVRLALSQFSGMVLGLVSAQAVAKAEDVPELLATRELPRFMKILANCGVTDPQILFMAVGDATSDRAPLQIGQFESTAELMDQWLTWSYLEGGGGASFNESYELALYVLARHTDMDCWARRRHRGYAFLTGDELPYPSVSRHQVQALIADGLDADVPIAEVVAAAQETFHVFFLIPDTRRAERIESTWRKLLGDHVVVMEDPGDTCLVAAGAVALTEGLVPNLGALAAGIEASAGPDRVGAVLRALNAYAGTLGRSGDPSPHLGPIGRIKGIFNR
jgi:hypothetical protein